MESGPKTSPTGDIVTVEASFSGSKSRLLVQLFNFAIELLEYVPYDDDTARLAALTVGKVAAGAQRESMIGARTCPLLAPRILIDLPDGAEVISQVSDARDHPAK